MFSLPRLSPRTHRYAERLWAYPSSCHRSGLLLCQRVPLSGLVRQAGRSAQDGQCYTEDDKTGYKMYELFRQVQKKHFNGRTCSTKLSSSGTEETL